MTSNTHKLAWYPGYVSTNDLGVIKSPDLVEVKEAIKEVNEAIKEMNDRVITPWDEIDSATLICIWCGHQCNDSNDLEAHEEECAPD